MGWSLREAALGERVLVAAHCGVFGGFVPGNSLGAFDAAVFQGAEIVELDVTRSRDGTLFVMHPGKERSSLGICTRLEDMGDDEIRGIPRRSVAEDVTDVYLCTLDEALEHLKGRCFVNIDKFPSCPEDVIAVVRRHGMQAQVLVKTEAEEGWFRFMQERAPDIPYMVFAREDDRVSEALAGRGIQYVGTEVLFASEDSPLATAAYVERMHALGLVVWVNALQYATTAVLAAGHNDTISVTGNPQAGWGWLAERGYDVIQTDFVCALDCYLKSIGKR